jgi:hypothetical protein
MNYASRVLANEPIGSGVTEAACEVIVKQRLCGSGMKWTEDGAAVVLSLRTLSYTPGDGTSSGRRSIAGDSPWSPDLQGGVGQHQSSIKPVDCASQRGGCLPSL